MDNLILVPLLLIIVSVVMYYKKPFKKVSKEDFDSIYEDRIKSTSTPFAKDLAIKQVYRKDISLQSSEDPFYKAHFIDLEVIDIKNGYVQYCVVGTDHTSSQTINGFLRGSTLIKDVE